MRGAWIPAVAAAGLLLAGLQVAAEEVMYRCGGRNGVTYSQAPCSGGKVLGAQAPRRTSRAKVPPQDRATRARRAQLSAQGRQECRALDAALREQSAAFKAKGAAATLADETPLIKSKLRFRELRC